MEQKRSRFGRPAFGLWIFSRRGWLCVLSFVGAADLAIEHLLGPNRLSNRPAVLSDAALGLAWLVTGWVGGCLGDWRTTLGGMGLLIAEFIALNCIRRGGLAGFGVDGLLFMIPLTLATHSLTAMKHRLPRRHPPGLCEACGYELTGNVSGRCPECGRPAK